MADLAHYSPEEITVLFAGVSKINGFADGTFVSISKDTQSFTSMETSDGQVGRTHNNSKLYTVRLTLASYSEYNQVLTYAHRADEITRLAKFPLIIKDQSGESLFFSPTCWIEDIPDTEYGTDISERQWVIKCAEATMNLGGNFEESSAGEDFLNTALGLFSDFIR